ncbi:hypothetical protein [Pseudomonas fluorescens]|uniref:hypothetical protein n=1 Tax=Pseudomonas fluorescens TaxID=294 RepID=UPI0012FD01BC|nr:hypothetical protein [Pseudomonas fluorescens]
MTQRQWLTKSVFATFFVAFLLRGSPVISGVRSVVVAACSLLTAGGNNPLSVVIAGRIENTHFLLLACGE